MWLKFLQAVFFGSVGIIIVVTGIGIAWGIILFFKKLWNRIFDGKGLFD